VLFTYELARRLPVSANTTVNALHPGIVNTELQRRGRGGMQTMV
jgi:retinol dehydrogenase-14